MVAKFQMILQFFRSHMRHATQVKGEVSFHRRVLPQSQKPGMLFYSKTSFDNFTYLVEDWKNSTAALCNLEARGHGSIESVLGAIHVRLTGDLLPLLN